MFAGETTCIGRGGAHDSTALIVIVVILVLVGIVVVFGLVVECGGDFLPQYPRAAFYCNDYTRRHKNEEDHPLTPTLSSFGCRRHLIRCCGRILLYWPNITAAVDRGCSSSSGGGKRWYHT